MTSNGFSQADDDSMASASKRVQELRQKLDLMRDKLDVELDTGTARDRELVVSYEKRVEDLRTEIDGILKPRARQIRFCLPYYYRLIHPLHKVFSKLQTSTPAPFSVWAVALYTY